MPVLSPGRASPEWDAPVLSPGRAGPERATQPSPREQEVNSVKHKQNQRLCKQPRKTHRASEILVKTAGATITTVKR